MFIHGLRSENLCRRTPFYHKSLDLENERLLSLRIQTLSPVRSKIFGEVQTLSPGISHNLQKYQKPLTLSDSKNSYPLKNKKIFSLCQSLEINSLSLKPDVHNNN